MVSLYRSVSRREKIPSGRSSALWMAAISRRIGTGMVLRLILGAQWLFDGARLRADGECEPFTDTIMTQRWVRLGAEKKK